MEKSQPHNSLEGLNKSNNNTTASRQKLDIIVEQATMKGKKSWNESVKKKLNFSWYMSLLPEGKSGAKGKENKVWENQTIDYSSFKSSRAPYSNNLTSFSNFEKSSDSKHHLKEQN